MKVFFIIIIAAIYVICVRSQNLNEPLQVSGRVANSSGGFIAENDFHLQVYLNDHPGNFLTESSLSCGYAPPIWYIELGNLPQKWTRGEILTILIEDYRKNEQVRYDWIIDSTGIVSDLKTQAISADLKIYNFTLSDRGVFRGNPIKFIFNSVFSQLTDLKLLIVSNQGGIAYQSDKPEKLEVNKYQFTWDGRSQYGGFLRSGIYFYFLSINQNVIHSGLVSLKND